MNIFDLHRAALEAKTTNPTRPAMAILYQSADVRLIIFRLHPGQAVPPHRSSSTVTLTVIAGRGYATGTDEERQLTPGMAMVYEPDELHGMRADTEPLVILAAIAPRPGERPSRGDA